VRELRVEHRHHVAPYAEGAHLGIDPGLARQLGHQMARYQIAKLGEYGVLTFGWGWSLLGSFFHTRPLTHSVNLANSNLFLNHSVGCLCLISKKIDGYYTSGFENDSAGPAC